MTSTCDAEFTRESDDSILVSGNPAPNDTYTIISVLDTGKITAFKLEVLADPRLPNRGPGRHSSGDFVLSELVLEAIPEKPGESHHVPISQVWASFAAKNQPIRNVTDGDPSNGMASPGPDRETAHGGLRAFGTDRERRQDKVERKAPARWRFGFRNRKISPRRNIRPSACAIERVDGE